MTPKYILLHLIYRHKILFVLSLITTIFLYIQVTFFYKDPIEYSHEPIDVVYTWVNGSDPNFLKSLVNSLSINTSQDSSPQRYDDKYELKFSLRSLEKYALWVRHVYIVTNGQIPYWLNLDFEGVTIIEHQQIFPYSIDLPTFSSPAIETHLHRIPGISKRFIYLNDDIFFGRAVYPEDFYSRNRGFLVYLAWPVPPCAMDCPWMYVNDGQCDHQCYNKACQMDGNDCDEEEKDKDGNLVNQLNDHNSLLYNDKIKVNVTNSSPLLQNESYTAPFIKLFNLKSSNLSQIINEHNERVIKGNKLRRKKFLRKFNSTLLERVRKIRRNVDTFGESLQYTNRLLNEKYGYKPRYVAAHAPIMIDTEIMGRFQEKFSSEVKRTSRHKFRRKEDLQFSFGYYYFMMHETIKLDIGEVFDQFDVDGSGTWSDREIRKILTQLYELPLSYAIVDHFEFILTNCTLNLDVPEVSTPEFERYIDSKLPTISKYLVTNCPELKNILLEHFGTKPKYLWETISNSHSGDVTFKMLTSNVTDVVGHLDEIRRETDKFICLNDNLEVGRDEENDLVKSILYDFYLSMFPHPSKYELPVEFRNRFLYMSELKSWKRFHSQLKILLLITFLGLLYICTFRMYSKRVFVGLVNKIFT